MEYIGPEICSVEYEKNLRQIENFLKLKDFAEMRKLGMLILGYLKQKAEKYAYYPREIFLPDRTTKCHNRIIQSIL